MSKEDFVILPLVNPSFERTTIDLEKIREIACLGFDHNPPEDRATAWLALLHIYPLDPTTWVQTYQNIKKTYWDFVEFNLLKDWHKKNLPNQIPIEEYNLPDKGNQIMGTVHGDIVRTGRTIFFLPPKPIPGPPPEQADELMFQFGEHARRLERILYVFARMNPGLGYMQGFNELVTPFYYVFLKCTPIFNDDIDLVEALSFQCLQALLTETTLNEFYTTTDNSSIIMHNLMGFNELLKKHLPDEFKIIDSLNIHPLLYCFRWFNLLFSQEHELPFLLFIWDALFAHFDEFMSFVNYVAMGHLWFIRDRLVPGNYGGTITKLQNLIDIDIKEVIRFANLCWDKDHPKRKNSFFGSRRNSGK